MDKLKKYLKKRKCELKLLLNTTKRISADYELEILEINELSKQDEEYSKEKSKGTGGKDEK